MKILLVDDEPHILNALKRIFRGQSWEIVTAGSADEALLVLQNQKPELIITDYKMPGKDGLALARETLQVHPNLKIFLLSGTLCADEIPAELRLKLKLFSKPWNTEQLIAAIQEVEKAHS